MSVIHPRKPSDDPLNLLERVEVLHHRDLSVGQHHGQFVGLVERGVGVGDDQWRGRGAVSSGFGAGGLDVAKLGDAEGFLKLGRRYGGEIAQERDLLEGEAFASGR